MFIVFAKELRDMLRDRRTLFGMVFFPLIFFPLVTVGFGSVESKMKKQMEAESLEVAILGAERAPALAARLREAGGLKVVPAGEGWKQAIADKKLRAAIEFDQDFERKISEGGKPEARIYFYATESRSESAAERLEKVIGSYREELVHRRLAGARLPAGVLTAVKAVRQNVAAPEKVSGSRLGMFVPYMLIVLTLTGAMHPAMDLTAGEKERGTMETLLASAVSRRDIVLGKFLFTVTASLVTSSMALLSYGVTMKFAPMYAEQMTRGRGLTISALAAATIFFVVVPLAVVFAGTLLSVSLFAKSYKEAQNQTGPLLIFAFLPAMVGMLPGVELGPALALVPVLNVSLVAKEILTGNFPWLPIGITFVSTWAFAAAAVAACVKLFQREDVVFRA
jgi:sodium transport system permease protein